MICAKCGDASNPPDTRFCGACGHPMPPPPITAAGPAAVSALPADGQVPAAMAWGVGIATVFLPFIGIVMGIIYMRGAHPSRKATGKVWLILGLIMALVWASQLDPNLF